MKPFLLEGAGSGHCTSANKKLVAQEGAGENRQESSSTRKSQHTDRQALTSCREARCEVARARQDGVRQASHVHLRLQQSSVVQPALGTHEGLVSISSTKL